MGKEKGQPSASNMEKMIWNEELEKIAQTWANQCQFDHDKKRSLCDRTRVGQNLYISRSTRKKGLKEVLEKGVQSWYNEVKKGHGFPTSLINRFK